MSRRVALVTGCSEGGIGHALALEFASAGLLVYATALRMEEFAQELPDKGVRCMALDITDAGAVAAAVTRILRESQHIDVLVNNAGVGAIGPAVELDPSSLRRLLEVNVVGTVGVCQAVAPSMMDRRCGTIVNVGSVTAFVPTPWSAHYSASKAAVHAFTDAMRVELAPFGVRAVVLAPGGVVSNLAATINPALAPDTRYRAVEESIAARARLSDSGRAMPAAVFASSVVPQILAGRPPAYVSCGESAGLVLLLSWLPAWIKDCLLSWMFGIGKLAPHIIRASAPNCPESRKGI
ncbi:hypothetical protein H4S06_001571 [Coemansia sp. BCRC 34490]|nr:hypothetical protein H4S06_001571 [Coemansia sp. BCRC 34490]